MLLGLPLSLVGQAQPNAIGPATQPDPATIVD